MSNPLEMENRLRACRLSRGWSQDDLAMRAGISRTGVSAIESGRLVPSTAAALALAAALNCRVEDLFHLKSADARQPVWAFTPRKEPSRYWQANVSGRMLAFPAEAVSCGSQWHDGVYREGQFHTHGQEHAQRTLVVACCDPAAGLLASIYSQSTGYRMLVLERSSRAALALLAQGLVHVAGLHLGKAGASANLEAVRERLGPGYQLVRVARWEEGVAVSPDVKPKTVRSLVQSRLRWIGREPGSGARHCLDELLGKRPTPRRTARDHRGVAEAIRSSWADVGVCVRLVSEESGLDFLSVREEDYDLCFADAMAADPRILALLETLRSGSYRQLLGELPGYSAHETGELQTGR